MAKTTPVQIITDLIRQVLPLLIIGGGSIAMPQLALLLLPVVFIPLLEKMMQWATKLYEKIRKPPKKFTVRVARDMVSSLLWGLSQYNKEIFQSHNAASVVLKYRGTHTVSSAVKEILFSASPNNGDTIKYKGLDMTIIKREETKVDDGKQTTETVYSVSSTNLGTIYEFIKEVSAKYSDHIHAQYKKKEKEFTSPESFKFTEKNGWTSGPLCVSKNFDNVFLEEEDQKLITERIKLLENKEYYTNSGKPRKVCVLLHGLPGCGKSSTSFALASEFKYHIYNVKLSALKDRDDFEKAVSTIPSRSLVVFEEIDINTINREEEKKDGDKEKGKTGIFFGNRVTLQDILEVLDGYTYFNECVVVLTTNYRERLDSALIRPGRVDLEIEYKHASAKLMKRIVTHQAKILKFGEMKLSDDYFAKYDHKFTSSHIINVCESSKTLEEALAKF
nr:ATPase AAA [Kaumoebavirus]